MLDGRVKNTDLTDSAEREGGREGGKDADCEARLTLTRDLTSMPREIHLTNGGWTGRHSRLSAQISVTRAKTAALPVLILLD